MKYLRPYWKLVALSLLLLLGESLTQVAGPLLTKYAVDRYLSPTGGTPWLDPYFSALPWTGLGQVSFLYLLAIVSGFLFNFSQSYIMQLTGQRAMFDLRRDLMDHLQRLDIAYFDQNPVGRLVTRVTTDVDVLNDLFTSGLVSIVGDLAVLTFVFAAMLRLSWQMTLVLLAVMPFVILITMIFRRTVAQSYRRIRVAVARINAYLQEHVNGMVVLQLFNREPRARVQFAGINRDHMEAYKDSITAYGWFYPAVEFLGMLSIAGLLSYGGFKIRSGEMTIGALIAFFQYGMRVFRPIQDLSEKYNILQGAMASSERIFKLLDTQPVVVSPAATVPFPEVDGAVEFDHVWFAYKDEDWVLQDVSFRIEPGETIAVVGHTGAGKTTITNLLLRFYDIQRGSIRIGGVDIRQFALQDLRRHFSIVLQDSYLFTGDIASNIRLGSGGISDAEVEESARQVNLSNYVESLPLRFGHAVRERGNGFSTGQKQLISFARALAHRPRYLILDEATSSVDTETELQIRDALNRLVTGRTSIVIAHRLSTIQRSDRILVMHRGRLRESGSHQQLLAQGGIYAKLYRLQYKDQEVAQVPRPAVSGVPARDSA